MAQIYCRIREFELDRYTSTGVRLTDTNTASPAVKSKNEEASTTGCMESTGEQPQPTNRGNFRQMEVEDIQVTHCLACYRQAYVYRTHYNVNHNRGLRTNDFNLFDIVWTPDYDNESVFLPHTSVEAIDNQNRSTYNICIGFFGENAEFTIGSTFVTEHQMFRPVRIT